MSTERTFFSGKKISDVFSYFNESTILIIIHIIKIIDFRVFPALLLLAATSLGISYVWIQNSPQSIIFTAEQISYLTLPDTRLQTTFYSFFCIAIFCFFLTAGLFAPNWFQSPRNSTQNFSSIAHSWFRPWLGFVFWAIVLIAYEPKARDFLLALAAAYLMKETIKDRFRTIAIAIMSLAVIFFICIFPLGIQHEIGIGRLWAMDIHWSAVLGVGLYTDTIVRSEFDAFAGYGVLLNDIIASARFLPLFETLGGTLSFLKIINLTFCMLIIGIIFQRLGAKNSRMIWATIILVLVVFSAMMSGVANTYDTPNLLPVRFLMIPATVILAYFLANREWSLSSIILGIIAPLFVFYNFETGTYCILALGFALFIENARKGLMNLFASGSAFAISFMLSGSLFILILFDGSLVSNFAELIRIMNSKIQSGSSGFAGLSAYFFVPFIIIMIHTAVLFSRYLLSVRDEKPLSSVEFQSIVIVGLIIAIGPYVMNRFHVLNMWIPFLLYTLLVLPRLTIGTKADRVIWSFILIVLIIPFIFGNPVRRLISKDFVSAVSERVDGHLAPCLNGIKASPNLCAYALEKADELRNLEKENPGLKWMSGLALNMTRLTGMQPALSQKAPFFFGHREETRNILVSMLRHLHAPFIAFDNATPDNIAGIPQAVEEFQGNLIRDAGYQVIDETKYWLIARKRHEN